MIIIHTVLEEFWNNCSGKEFYGDSSMDDGFIHCSTFDTVLDVANSHFRNCGQVLLVCIDTDEVISEIKWEDLKNCGIKFPHIYGLLNMTAIVDTLKIDKDNSGNFYLPDEIQYYR